MHARCTDLVVNMLYPESCDYSKHEHAAVFPLGTVAVLLINGTQYLVTWAVKVNPHVLLHPCKGSFNWVIHMCINFNPVSLCQVVLL